MNYGSRPFFSNHVKKKTDPDGAERYYAQNRTGNGIMTSYAVAAGIDVFYNDFHMSDCSTIGLPVSYPGLVELNHCREGRFECEYGNEFCYVGEGDFIAVSRMTVNTRSCFPLSHYHGITVLLDFNKLTADNRLFAEFGIDLLFLKRKLCNPDKKIVLRKNPSVEHIFSELYTVHDAARPEYLKLKVLELLLFLTTSGILDCGEVRRSYNCIQIRKIKAVKQFMCQNFSAYYTLEQLAEKFGMSLTSLKQGFRAVYGLPPASFMREFRIQQAAHLLRTTDDSVLSVASQVGYDNASKFAAAFHAIMKRNPAEYRRISS